MSERIHVASTDELRPGDHRIVLVDGVSIAVKNFEGEYYAIESSCCHDDGPICQGTIRKQLEAQFEGPGERVRENYTGDLTITCPWHGWEYDLETGDHVGDNSYSLQTYDVAVENGDIYVTSPEN